MQIKDLHFRPFIPEAELQALVADLAARISADYAGRHLVVSPILTGAFMFGADLVRLLTLPCEVSFIRYASYSGLASTGTVQCQLPLSPDIRGRHLLIVEDVVDSGLTIQRILADARALEPASVAVCALFFKPDAFRGDYRIDYIGRPIGNEFIVGYGLDYDEQGRNLKEIYVLDQQ